MLGFGCDAVGQRGGHRGRRSAGLSGRHQEEPNVAGHAGIVGAVLPVAVEGEDTLTLREPGGSVSVLDGVDVGREVAGLDPLLEVLGSEEVRRRIDRRAGLIEDPVVDRSDRAVGGHQLLEREGKPHAALGTAPLHDRLEPGGLGRGKQGIELGDRLGRLGHADLGGQLLVVENAGQAVVETHGVKRAGTADAVWSTSGSG